MEIVRATAQDISGIQTVAEATWPHTFKDILSPGQIRYMLNRMYSYEALYKSIADPNQSFWIFQNEGKTIGFAGIEHHYRDEPATKLHKIYILPDAQGMQVGRKLLEHVKAEARKAGSTQLFLNVNRFNKATGFYEHAGFRIAGEEDIDIGNGYLMEDYIMLLDL
jgi:N-acetylglutamate synthase-like GNAT family acetyltransferase